MQAMTAPGVSTAPNHPLAVRMAVIAFLVNNVTVGTLYGSFSVLLGAIESRFQVGRELSTLSLPLVNLAMALCAPLVGAVAGRFSIRIVMLTGMACATAAFAILSTTTSYPVYLFAYGALLGPALAVGVILPATLVTNWFARGRGRALGLVTVPAMVAAMPLLASWVLQATNLTTTYAMLAVLTGLAVIATLFVVDRPPNAAIADADDPTIAAPADGPPAMSVGELIRIPSFWALAIAAAASTTSSVILAAHMVPMAASWGYSTTLAATLLSVMSLTGIAGTVLFGWIADRLGGAAALAIVVFDGAILWALLLLHPPFPVLLILIGLIGVHGAGVLPVLGLVLSQAFGQQNFGRAYGIANMVNLPFSVACIPLAAVAFTATGSYSPAIVGQILFFGIATLLALSARPARRERQKVEAV